MRKALIGMLTIATVVCAATAVMVWREGRALKREQAEMERQIVEITERLERERSAAEQLRNQLRETRRAAADLAPAAAGGSPSANAGPSVAGGDAAKPKASNPFAEMFKNPEMRQMIRTQQKSGIANNIDKNYAKFLSEFQMTPEQVAAFKDLMAKKMAIDAEVGMQIMSGELEPAKRKEVVEKAKADKDLVNAELKEFLGEDNYKALEAYDKTQQERSTVSRFRERLDGGATPLSGEQESQLIQALNETRTGFKFTTDFNDQSKLAADMSSFFTDERIEMHGRETEQLHQQYVERVRAILSPEQLADFERYLANQREMQKTSMQMARTMFTPKKEEGK